MRPYGTYSIYHLAAATHTMLTPMTTVTIDRVTGTVKRRWNHTISMTATKGMIRSLAI